MIFPHELFSVIYIAPATEIIDKFWEQVAGVINFMSLGCLSPYDSYESQVSFESEGPKLLIESHSHLLPYAKYVSTMISCTGWPKYVSTMISCFMFLHFYVVIVLCSYVSKIYNLMCSLCHVSIANSVRMMSQHTSWRWLMARKTRS